MNLSHRPSKVLVTGCSGSGKSTFATKYLANTKATLKLVFDHELEFAYRSKLPVASSEKELADQVKTGIVIFDPAKMFPGKAEEALAFFLDFSLEISDKVPGRKVLFVDEIQLFVDVNRWPPELARVIQTGRRYELDLLLCSQQANELHNRLRQQLTEVVTFRQQDPRAIDWLVKVGPFLPEDVSELPPGSYLAWQRVTGRVSPGRVF